MGSQIEHRIDLPDQMIRRRHLVEFKRIKELALSTLSSPHHGHCSRDSSSHPDGITVHPFLNESFATHSPRKRKPGEQITAYSFLPSPTIR